jgi:hypothetical protein
MMPSSQNIRVETRAKLYSFCRREDYLEVVLHLYNDPPKIRNESRNTST